MFDLKYYREISNSEKYFDEFLGNAFSRKNIHNVSKNGHKNIIKNCINDLPESDDMKMVIKTIYDSQGKGEGGVKRFINSL